MSGRRYIIDGHALRRGRLMTCDVDMAQQGTTHAGELDYDITLTGKCPLSSMPQSLRQIADMIESDL